MAELGDVSERLLAEARASLSPVRMRVERHADGFVAELVRDDGSVLWPNYAHGPDELLAALAAEQRYLVEERGAGAVRGASYLDIANERLRRALSDPLDLP